jgi:hypothetical protein
MMGGIPWRLMFWMARQNVALYSKVIALEARDRARLRRIARLKIALRGAGLEDA